MTPVRDKTGVERQPTVGTVLARVQPEGRIDPIGTTRAAMLIDLLTSMAELVKQRAEIIAHTPANACTPNRALLELVAARAMLAEGIALVDELMTEWTHKRDAPITTDTWY